MLGLGSRFLFYAILASVASAIQHGFMRSSLKAAAPPSKGMAGRRALISGTAWFALAQVSKADEVKPWMKAFERSAAEPKEVPLDKKGLCATGFFVNYNPGMCTDIGDITQVGYLKSIVSMSSRSSQLN